MRYYARNKWKKCHISVIWKWHWPLLSTHEYRIIECVTVPHLRIWVSVCVSLHPFICCLHAHQSFKLRSILSSVRHFALCRVTGWSKERKRDLSSFFLLHPRLQNNSGKICWNKNAISNDICTASVCFFLHSLQFSLLTEFLLWLHFISFRFFSFVAIWTVFVFDFHFIFCCCSGGRNSFGLSVFWAADKWTSVFLMLSVWIALAIRNVACEETKNCCFYFMLSAKQFHYWLSLWIPSIACNEKLMFAFESNEIITYTFGSRVHYKLTGSSSLFWLCVGWCGISQAVFLSMTPNLHRSHFQHEVISACFT